MLLNALYFKGNWKYQFNVEDTLKGPFYLGSIDNKVEVDMMHMMAKMNNEDLPDLDARVLEIPYKVTKNYSDIQIFLPH